MFEFLKKIFVKNEWDDFPEEEDFSTGDWKEIAYNREQVDIHDRQQRKEYVQACLDQLADAEREMENLEFEYRMVTSYLKDMEEIEALPKNEKRVLQDAARKLEGLQGEQEEYNRKARKMTDEQYYQMEHLSDEVEEGCKKLTETEEYQKLIRHDLGKLDGERHAYRYRKRELEDTCRDCRALAVVFSSVLIIFLVVLLLLQFAFELDTKWGYILTAAATAGVYLFVYLKYHDSKQELTRVNRDINRLIQLQNRVKIRYVNNTNLLDYLYMKYKVTSATELTKMWSLYLEEKENRQKLRNAQKVLDENEKELLHILRRYQVKDPEIWLRQTDAILNPKEMVEIRHNLIIRRQSLRRRMDYNKEVVAGNARTEIRNLVESYPRYATEIQGMVAAYEQNMKSS